MIDFTTPIKLEPDKHYLEWLNEQKKETVKPGMDGQVLISGPSAVYWADGIGD